MPRAINICAEEAADIQTLPNNTVLISINDEYQDLYSLKLDRKDKRILTVVFTDITAQIEHLGKWYHPINAETSQQILNFIEVNKEKDQIIHCAAGISRSAAVCLFLHLFYNYELKKNFWKLSNPNKFVIGSLIFSKFQKSDIEERFSRMKI